jgi:hypothetical protein
MVGGGNTGDLIATIGEDGNFTGVANWLPQRFHREILTSVLPFAVGSILVCVCSATRCERAFSSQDCPCCSPGYRNAPQYCCSSIQVLDLSARKPSFIALPCPDEHLSEADLSNLCIYAEGSTLCLAGFTCGNAPINSIYKLDLDELAGDPSLSWKRVDRVHLLNHICDESYEKVLFKIHATDKCDLVSYACSNTYSNEWEDTDEDDANWRKRIAQNVIWINGKYRTAVGDYGDDDVECTNNTAKFGYSTVIATF